MTGDLSDIYGCAISATGAEIKNGKALCDNGAVIFTVSKSGEFYRFHNEAFGYLCSYGTGNNAYYSTELTDDANWTLEAYNGGYRMKSNAAFEDKSQYLQYFSGGFTTWGMYNVTDRDVFTYHFYPCANAKLTDGVVNEPKAVFGNLADALAGQRYMLHFTIDALFGVKELHVAMNGVELAYTQLDGHYTAVIPAEYIKGEKLTVRVYGADNKGVAIDSTVDIQIKDESRHHRRSPHRKRPDQERQAPRDLCGACKRRHEPHCHDECERCGRRLHLRERQGQLQADRRHGGRSCFRHHHGHPR